MRRLRQANLALLTLLSVSSGIAKILLLPQEVRFFGEAGFSNTVLVLFGVAQLLAGGALIPQKTRTIGAIAAALTFCIATLMIFKSGNAGFGVFSLLPVIMAGVVMKESARRE